MEGTSARVTSASSRSARAPEPEHRAPRQPGGEQRPIAVVLTAGWPPRSSSTRAWATCSVGPHPPATDRFGRARLHRVRRGRPECRHRVVLTTDSWRGQRQSGGTRRRRGCPPVTSATYRAGDAVDPAWPPRRAVPRRRVRGPPRHRDGRSVDGLFHRDRRAGERRNAGDRRRDLPPGYRKGRLRHPGDIGEGD